MSEPRSPAPPARGLLGAIERVGNALPDPATLFLLGALLVMALSALAAGANNVNGLTFSIEDTSGLVEDARAGAVGDAQARAEHLAALLNEGKICTARVADKDPNFDIQGNSNQMKVLWDMARAFRDYMKKNRADTYVLYADYLLSPRDGRAHGVHFAICDPRGDWVIVDLQNSHHDDFNSIDPKSVKDCNRLIARRLDSYL